VTYHLVVNGAASNADRDAAEVAAEKVRSGGVRAVVHTTDDEDALDDVIAAVDGGDVLVVCGGDGSVHVTVERSRACGRLAAITFAVIPMGTGNDLAGSLGIPADPYDAARAILAGRAAPLDLIVDDRDRICVNGLHAGIGVEAAERAQGMKDRLGDGAYVLGALSAGMRTRDWDVEVLVDGRPLRPGASDDGRVLLVAVMNGPTVGGGTPIAPGAELDDGLLDVVVTTATGPAARAAFGVALTQGGHLGRDDVASRTGREVRIHGQPIPFNIDGELEEEGSPDRRFHIEPGAWHVVRPAR
jgi:diacylglycerol kinase family enzyme